MNNGVRINFREQAEFISSKNGDPVILYALAAL
jgi:hypothetical protein